MENQSSRNPKKHRIWDIVNNNPRAYRQHIDWEGKDKEQKFNNDNMLYDENSKSNKRLDLIKRMVRAHNKNVEKIGIAPKSAPLSAAEKRARKLEDLLSRWNSWKNLR
jgi:Xaa-Pro aminopeptidase